jgi:hypothetical protein
MKTFLNPCGAEMFACRLAMPIVLIALFGWCGTAQAGWLVITNDTKQTLVIQETAGPLNRPVRGKCVKLKPGETYREFQLLPGVRTVVLYDAAQPCVPLLTDKLTWGRNDSTVAIETNPKGINLNRETKEPTTNTASKR